MSTKINGFAHAGVDGTFYDGTRGPEIAATTGLTDLDVRTWGSPLLTRGVLLDVVAHRARTTGDVESTANGRITLPGNAHVTIADLEAALEASGADALEPGDAVLLRTGWINLTRTDPARFLQESPGPWLLESRWLAQFRPALVGTDSFMFGTFDPSVSGGQLGANHQVLLTEHGIRVGESVYCEELADAGVTTFVFCHAPFPARGAVASNSPPMAIANVDDLLAEPAQGAK
jgi:kynurenine formamidase